MAFKRKRSYAAKRMVRKRARFIKRKRYIPRRNRRYLRSLLRYSETKYNSITTNWELFHNAGTAGASCLDFNLLQTGQGQTQFTRIGDKVWAKGLKIKLWFSNKKDRSTVMYRVAVVALPTDQVNSNPANLFNTSSGNRILDMINTDKYKVLYHKVFNINTTSKWTIDVDPLLNREREVSRYMPIYIPLNRMVTYSADNGNQPKYQKDILALMVIAYDSTGTLATDNIASYRAVYRFYFKDP